MSLKNIPDEHHVARACRRNRVIRKNGVPTGVFPQLYKLREATKERPKEQYLSAFYVEYFEGNEIACINRCVEASPFKIPDEDFMVVLNAGRVRAIGKSYRFKLKVVHDTGNRQNPAYARIIGTPEDPTHALLNALAENQVSKLYSVKTLRS